MRAYACRGGGGYIKHWVRTLVYIFVFNTTCSKKHSGKDFVSLCYIFIYFGYNSAIQAFSILSTPSDYILNRSIPQEKSLKIMDTR